MAKLTAKEADKLTAENSIPIESALEQIENAAKHGSRTVLFFNLNDAGMVELMNLGYSISKFTDPYGVKTLRVEW